MNLHEILKQITPPDGDARREAQRRWDACAKPLGSLGLLETAICDIAALTGSADVRLLPRAVLVLCADNGVVRQGVTQTDSSVTAAVALLDRRAGNGTGDLSEGPAMTRQQAEAAIRTGMELVRAERERGTRLLAGGEMGIGNTTTAAAVTAVLTGSDPERVTGRGAGLSDEGLQRKLAAIRRGIAVNRPDAGNALDVLAKLGGFDLAGLCGVFLGGALYRIPVLIDGFPAAAAALCALRLCPAAGKAMLASHVSAEPAGALLLRALGKEAFLTAGMRLGEGSGAVAAMPLLDMALAVYRECYTFSEGGIAPYRRL